MLGVFEIPKQFQIYMVLSAIAQIMSSVGGFLGSTIVELLPQHPNLSPPSEKKATAEICQKYREFGTTL